MIRFACPRCRTEYSAPYDSAGQQTGCAHCDATVIIPEKTLREIVYGIELRTSLKPTCPQDRLCILSERPRMCRQSIVLKRYLHLMTNLFPNLEGVPEGNLLNRARLFVDTDVLEWRMQLHFCTSCLASLHFCAGQRCYSPALVYYSRKE